MDTGVGSYSIKDTIFADDNAIYVGISKMLLTD